MYTLSVCVYWCILQCSSILSKCTDICNWYHLFEFWLNSLFVWVMGPQRLVTFVISALEMFLLTYYWEMPFSCAVKIAPLIGLQCWLALDVVRWCHVINIHTLLIYTHTHAKCSRYLGMDMLDNGKDGLNVLLVERLASLAVHRVLP